MFHTPCKHKASCTHERTAHEGAWPHLHKALALSIQCTRSFVEEQHTWVFQHSARDCNALLLPAAEGEATALAQQRAVLVGLPLNELHSVRNQACSTDLFQSGVMLSVSQILQDCAVE